MLHAYMHVSDHPAQKDSRETRDPLLHGTASRDTLLTCFLSHQWRMHAHDNMTS